ncbi:MAG TPA: nicotinate-nucleotide adenylyltransferase [Ramlibacter sp.]|uniref:nicotinate-nucleotide adenylyltransferase n=1 Tax=Ramlibacter sp. TaxID=1917967 RepID=UPI002D08C782|nr:nicotinate-nucleotide adenylyltransferase [Ramlibacter sp.]HVZ46583.1 nicotinate-nucleotide adenylyltransferase [Ramlibacter sp.]
MSATRLGMFGGAFDPPHRAHVVLVGAAVAQLALDELRVFPTGDAWHKARALTPAADRLAMARLAFEGLPAVTVDDRELRRSGPTYTIDTLRELRAERADAELFLVMGEDQASAFTTWRDWRAIAAMATLAVARRPGAAAQVLPPEVRTAALEFEPMRDSATDIRARLTRGQDVSQLVPAAVAGYIDRHCLYRTT